MSEAATKKSLHDWVYLSFLSEVNALKPGNVSRYAAGHNMRIEDFKKSAELTSPILCNSQFSVGERIYKSVKATMKEVGCNTNLGMLLLFTPMIVAAEKAENTISLRKRLGNVLDNLDEDDAEHLFRAIRLAKPGGLGKSEKYDVNSIPEISVLKAMEEAKKRDRIALQYVTAFDDVFTIGLDCIGGYVLRWNSVEWSASMCYMEFLCRFRDSHIARKHGEASAEEIKNNSKGIAALLKKQEKPDLVIPELLQYDSRLKKANINPGTTADLTAASILAYYLELNNL